MESGTFSARASLAGYVVLSGIWFVLGAANAWLYFVKPSSSVWKASLVCFLGGALWVVWLRGFRLCIDGDLLTYRDGMYRTQRGSVSRITAVRSARVKWKRLPREIRVPRLVIEFEGGRSITINPKPFARSALAAFKRKVEASLQRLK